MDDKLLLSRLGKHKLSFDAHSFLAIASLSSILLVSTFGLFWTFLSFFGILPIVLTTVIRKWPKINMSNFYITWTLSSFLILIISFELQIVPYMEILFHENSILVLLTGLALTLTLVTRKKSTEIEVVNAINHCLWLNCHIHSGNQRYFLGGLFFSILALLYYAHLTLTTICHSSIIYDQFLMPDDCSDILLHGDVFLRSSFSCAIYGLEMGFCLIIAFFWQLVNQQFVHKNFTRII